MGGVCNWFSVLARRPQEFQSLGCAVYLMKRITCNDLVIVIHFKALIY